MNYCPNCKINVHPILKQHPTLQLATLTCPRCDSTYLKPPRVPNTGKRSFFSD